MAFRILIIGGRHRFEYAQLRAALDALLVNRLPDVEILTAGGQGVPTLAACYASERKLRLTAIALDYSTHRGNAEDWRNGRLVELADAAVLVGGTIEVRRLLDQAMAKGLRIAAIGDRSTRHETGEPMDEDDGTGMVRGLPD